MARVGVAGANAGLNGLDGTGGTNVIGFFALNVSDPGTSGAGENANSGGYARQAVTWNTAGSSAKTNSTALTISTLGTIADNAFSLWNNGTYGAGNYALGGLLGASVTAASITVASGAISIGES